MAEHNFSTLEVVDTGYQHFSNEKISLAEQGKHPVPEDFEKHVIPSTYSNHDASSGLEATVHQDLIEQKHQPPAYEETKNGRKLKWIVLGVVGLMAVILAAVLGGVLGSRKSKSSSTASVLPPPPTATSTTSSGSNSTSSNLPQQFHFGAVAAVAWESREINTTRVYYQTKNGNLVEAANSANDTTWHYKTIGNSSNFASSLAAAVSRPDFPLEISLFYTDKNNLVHDLVYNMTTHGWVEGNISNEKYITHPNSSLTAMYNQCRRCANTTLLAYQDVNGFVQFANSSSSGWKLSQLGINAYTGTGLALQPFYRANVLDQINLYYQTTSLNITLATTGVNGVWSETTQVYDVGIPGTPLAAAASYTNVSAGYESWIELLQISKTGIEVNTWSGNINDWLDQYNKPSVMTNSSINSKTYSAIAMTSIGSAFAVVNSGGNDTIQSYQVNDNLVDWTSTGTVVSVGK